jgi:ribosome-binding factor A
MKNRPERVAKILKAEIGHIIHDDLKDPRIGFVSITHVELSRDLKYAKVYFSILGDNADAQKTVQGLLKATGYIKKLIGERLKLRFTPAIVFKLDRSIEYNIHLSEILAQENKSDPADKALTDEDEDFNC